MFAKTSSSLVAGILLAAGGLSTIAAEPALPDRCPDRITASQPPVDDDGLRHGIAEMRYRDRPPQDIDRAVGGLPDSDVRIAASTAEPASAVSLFWPEGPGQQDSSPRVVPVIVPVIVYLRKAGSARSDREHAGAARALAKSAAAVVVSVSLQADQTGDGLAAYQWALANASDLGGDPQRVAVMGEGGAGPVAMAVAADAQHAHLPPPYYLVLVNAPTTSVAIQPATARLQPAAGPHLQDIAWPAVRSRSARSTNKTYRAM